MQSQRTDRKSAADELVTHDELAEALERQPTDAQGASAGGGPLVGLVVELNQYNRYTVQLADAAQAGQSPAGIADAKVEAINLAEPFDQAGQLEAGTPLLIWPSQGLYFASQPAGGEAAESGYWAKVVSGSGPTYTVRHQAASGQSTFADAGGAGDVTAANTWELSVDTAATADVPAGAIVRIHEEPDGDGMTRRFFFYPIHAVYR